MGCMDLSGQGAQVSVVSSRSVNWGRTEGPCVQLLNGDPPGETVLPRPSLSFFKVEPLMDPGEHCVRMKTPEI